LIACDQGGADSQELQHRDRNTFAIVEAIVRNTLVHDRENADAIAGRAYVC